MFEFIQLLGKMQMTTRLPSDRDNLTLQVSVCRGEADKLIGFNQLRRFQQI